MGIFNGIFQITSRIPFLGDVVLAPYTLKRVAPHIIKGQWKHVGAEVLSCAAQMIGDDIVPIIGRDLGHELVRLAVGKKYLPRPSLLLGKVFDRLHPAEALPLRPAGPKNNPALPRDVG